MGGRTHSRLGRSNVDAAWSETFDGSPTFVGSRRSTVRADPPPRSALAVDLRGHYSNLPNSRLRPLMPNAEWCQVLHDLHERLIQ